MEGNKLLRVYEEFKQKPTTENIDKFQTVLSELSKTHGGTFAQLARDIDPFLQHVIDAATQTDLLKKSLEGIADIKHPALENLEKQIALFAVPKGIERTIRARQQHVGFDPHSEEGQTLANLMRDLDRRTRKEEDNDARLKQLEGQEKFIAGLVFQQEQLTRSPLKQQVHAAFRAQNVTDVESPNAQKIRANIGAIETQKKEIQARNQALADVKALYNATRTPLERYNDELTKLDTLFEQAGINAEFHARGIEQARTHLENATGVTAQHNQAMAEAEALTRSLMTTHEQYNAQITRFQELLKGGFITQDVFEQAKQQADDALAALQPVEVKIIDLRRLVEHSLDFSRPFDTMVKGFGNALAQMLRDAAEAEADLVNALFGRQDAQGRALSAGLTGEAWEWIKRRRSFFG